MSLVLINGAYVPSFSIAGVAVQREATINASHYLLASNNLSDVDNPALARANLGIGDIGSSRQHYFLNPSHSGSTLTTAYDDYFVNLSFGQSVNVTLPDAELMAGRELSFTNRTNVSEAWCSIYGPIQNGSSFMLPAYSTVKLLCDGTQWWISSYYN